MSETPIEEHFVTRVVIVVTLAVAMLYAGEAAGRYLSSLDIPYAEWLGILLGIVVVYIPFAILYRYYEAQTKKPP